MIKHTEIAVTQLVVHYMFTNYQWHLNHDRQGLECKIWFNFYGIKNFSSARPPPPLYYVKTNETSELKMMSHQGFKPRADLLIGLCRHLHNVVLKFTSEYEICLWVANICSHNLIKPGGLSY